MNAEVKEKLEAAIKVMEEACLRSRLELKRQDGEDPEFNGDVINAVTNNLTWALANAMTEVQNAHRRNIRHATQ